MHPLISSRHAAIATLCRRYGVRRLDVFGSALRPDFDPDSSDIDLVVDFDSAGAGSRVDRYFGLKESLESLFERPVDLVELNAMRSQRLKRIVDRTRVPVYAAAA
ncbi:MAG: DNA polymerase III subunit beta [Gammaproteobacteria bacterium]|nr:DNA polymerase III subunit beta [Gammaproteobacteria bacterium]